MPRRAPSRDIERAIDAHRVAPGLYQGAVPPEGYVLRHLGFGMVVLCAIEHQPPASAYPGIRVLHAPFDDASEPVDEATWETARQASREAAKQLLKGRRVLVTCHMGINRSGLVSALTLLRLTPMSGEDAVRTVQSRRPGALSNPYFVDAVLSAR